jgi:hypothetical protein
MLRRTCFKSANMFRTLIDYGDNDSIRFYISTYRPKGTVNWTTSEWLTLWYLAGLVWFARAWISFVGYIENELINTVSRNKCWHPYRNYIYKIELSIYKNNVKFSNDRTYYEFVGMIRSSHAASYVIALMKSSIQRTSQILSSRLDP